MAAIHKENASLNMLEQKVQEIRFFKPKQYQFLKSKQYQVLETKTEVRVHAQGLKKTVCHHRQSPWIRL